MASEYFPSEQALFEHLISGGMIRPHFEIDRVRKKYWICLKEGNRVYLESGKPASNCLMTLSYWVKASDA